MDEYPPGLLVPDALLRIRANIERGKGGIPACSGHAPNSTWEDWYIGIAGLSAISPTEAPPAHGPAAWAPVALICRMCGEIRLFAPEAIHEGAPQPVVLPPQ